MKLTIYLDTDVEADRAFAEYFANAIAGGDTIKARDTARELHGTKNNMADDIKLFAGSEDTAPENEGDEPTFRAYGESSEGRARRTKVEMAQDENIEALFAQAKELGAKGLPKTISTDLPADDIETELTTMIEVLGPHDEPEEEEGFEVDGDGPATAPMDLDEFRAILTKGVKELGGKDVGALMKPYKSATDVPEDERNDYAQKLNDALNG